MNVWITAFSNLIIPLIIFYIVAYGIAAKCNVYEEFIKGAKEGLILVFNIAPTLIALIVGVGVLRSSGLVELFGNMLFSLIGIKMFSASAATGILIDIYKNYGTDSYIGIAASLICSTTETLFYTMSVYFLSVKVTKTRFTLVGALLAMSVGVVVSLIMAGYLI